MMVSWRPDFFLIRSKRKVYILKKKYPRERPVCALSTG